MWSQQAHWPGRVEIQKKKVWERFLDILLLWTVLLLSSGHVFTKCICLDLSPWYNNVLCFQFVGFLYYFSQLSQPRLRPSRRHWRPRRLCWRECTATGRRRSGPALPSAGPRLCAWGGSLSTLGRAHHEGTSEFTNRKGRRSHISYCMIRCGRVINLFDSLWVHDTGPGVAPV